MGRKKKKKKIIKEKISVHEVSKTESQKPEKDDGKNHARECCRMAKEEEEEEEQDQLHLTSYPSHRSNQVLTKRCEAINSNYYYECFVTTRYSLSLGNRSSLGQLGKDEFNYLTYGLVRASTWERKGQKRKMRELSQVKSRGFFSFFFPKGKQR